MIFRVKERKFYREYNNDIGFGANLGSFATHLKGSIMEKQKAFYNIEVAHVVDTNDGVVFEVKSIVGATFVVSRNFGSFKEEGWFIGQNVQMMYKDSASGPPVPSIEFTGAISFVNDDEIGIAGTAPAAGLKSDHVLYGTDKPLHLVYNFNTIENNAPTDFNSLVDGQEQGFYGSLDAGSPTTLQVLDPIAPNKSWITGDADFVFISSSTPYSAVVGALPYLHIYELNHTFTITPYFIEEFRANLKAGTLPDLFDALNTLKYINNFGLRYALTNPNSVLNGGDVDTLGSVGYFGENFNGFGSNYTVADLVYAGGATALSRTDETSLTFTITGTGAAFDAATKVGLYHSYLPSVEEYTDGDNLFDENFKYDRLFAVADSALVPGANIIKELTVTLTSPTVLTVVAKVDLPANTITAANGYLLGVQVGDAEDVDLSDTVMELVDCQEYRENNDVSGLLTFGGMTHFKYGMPEVDGGKTDFKLFRQSGALTVVPFTIDKNLGANVRDVTFRLIAYKSDEEQFELQNFLFDMSSEVVVTGTPTYQILNIDTTRGFKLPDASQYNYVKLISGVPSAGVQTWVAKVGWKADWQSWLALPGADTIFYNASKPNNGLNKNAANYNLANGYALRVVMDINMLDEDGGVTLYREMSPDGVIQDYDSTTWTQTITTEDLDGNNLNGEVRTDKDTVFIVEWTPPSLPFTLPFGFGVHRLEVEGASDYGAIDEITSLMDGTYTGNVLYNDGAQSPYLRYEVLADKIRTTCIIDHTKLDKGKCYTTSAELCQSNVEPPYVEWDNVTFDSGTLDTTGEFTLEVGQLLAYLGYPDLMTDGSPIVISIAKFDNADAFCYDAAKEYAIGEVVAYAEHADLTDIRYYTAIAVSTGVTPGTDPAKWQDDGAVTITVLETLTGNKNSANFNAFTSVLSGGATDSVLNHLVGGAIPIDDGNTIVFKKKEYAEANGFVNVGSLSLKWIIQGTESTTGINSNENVITLCKKSTPEMYRTAWSIKFINAAKTESMMLNATSNTQSAAIEPTLRHVWHHPVTHDILYEELVTLSVGVYGATLAFATMQADFGDMVNGYPRVYVLSKGNSGTSYMVLTQLTKNAGAGWTSANVWNRSINFNPDNINFNIDFALRPNGTPFFRIASRLSFPAGGGLLGFTTNVWHDGTNWTSFDMGFHPSYNGGVYPVGGVHTPGSMYYPICVITDTLAPHRIYVLAYDYGDLSTAGGVNYYARGKMSVYEQTLGSLTTPADRNNLANYTFKYNLYLNSAGAFNQDGTGAGGAGDGNMYWQPGFDLIGHDVNNNPIFLSAGYIALGGTPIKIASANVATPTTGAHWDIDSPMGGHTVGAGASQIYGDTYEPEGEADSAGQTNKFTDNGTYHFAQIDADNFLKGSNKTDWWLKLNIGSYGGATPSTWATIGPKYSGYVGNITGRTLKLKEVY